MGKAQIHELLAIENDLKVEKEKSSKSLIGIFKNEKPSFEGRTRRLEIFDEKRKLEEAAGIENIELDTTVPRELATMSKPFIRYWDVKYQQEISNQKAIANIEIDGKVFIENVPVKFLLSMEEELKQLRKVYEAAPTLPPGFDWTPDNQKGEDIFKLNEPIIKQKGEKVLDFVVAVKATDKFPAQIKERTIDRQIGKYIDNFWSGAITPAKKLKLLSRIDIISRAIKQARQRANTQEVSTQTIGKDIFDFINI